MIEEIMDFRANTVLQRMRNSLQNPANKLEGGFCMDNLQAVSEEIARLDLMEVQPIPDRVLLDTAEGEYLDRKALDYNETRNPAKAATGNLLFTGEPGTAIPSGTEVLCGNLVFETIVAARISADGYCEVGARCQTEGMEGNVAADTITTLRVAINGVKSVTNTVAFGGGAQAESDESFRSRILEKIRQGYVDSVNMEDFSTPPTLKDEKRQSTISYYRIGNLIFDVEGVASLYHSCASSNRPQNERMKML